MSSNLDRDTVAGFGFEWERFDQSELAASDRDAVYGQYFELFPWQALPPQAEGFDLGCGSGRWAKCVAPRVGRLHCIDASDRALSVARRNLAGLPNCVFHEASVENIPLEPESMDFGYSLGVLHHVPDTAAGIRSCVLRLKKGAPFLLYLYYAFDNRPPWFRLLWKSSDILRRGISRCPHGLRYAISQGIAAFVYFPLARVARLAERVGMGVSGFPLSYYRGLSFYTMRTDALDRFGTKVEQRFTARQIREMMTEAGLERIAMRDGEPFWCAVGFKK
ncbi:MAG: class I SAM-dependent methyltransferase [Acidobacteriota bacterium]|nr:class I SAM-dependent methyltransferase [Acidobacteriota bacterium]